MNETEMLGFLRTLRHDWLNQLQLIKGHLFLENQDKAEDIINRIILQSKNEANLTNLGVPKFACLLLTFDRTVHHFRIEFEVVDGPMDLSSLDSHLFEMMEAMIKWFDDHAAPFNENELFIGVDVLPNETVIRMEFDGCLIKGDKKSLPVLHQSLHWDQKYITEEEAVLSLIIKNTKGG